jgi:hypothetical protein
MDYQEIIAGTVGKDNTYGTVVGRCQGRAVHLPARRHHRPAGAHPRLPRRGHLTSDPLNTFGGVGVVQVRSCQELLRYICQNGFEHHVARTVGGWRGRT